MAVATRGVWTALGWSESTTSNRPRTRNSNAPPENRFKAESEHTRRGLRATADVPAERASKAKLSR
jgi:hypothetical protein